MHKQGLVHLLIIAALIFSVTPSLYFSDRCFPSQQPAHSRQINSFPVIHMHSFSVTSDSVCSCSSFRCIPCFDVHHFHVSHSVLCCVRVCDIPCSIQLYVLSFSALYTCLNKCVYMCWIWEGRLGVGMVVECI